MAPKYEFHRFGKKPFSADLGTHEGHLGEGKHGSVKNVKVVFGKKTLNMAEKFFNKPIYEIFKARNVFIVNKLKGLRLSTVPAAWLAMEGQNKTYSAARHIMTDISRGGKFRIIEWCGQDLQESPGVEDLSNYREIKEKIKKETKIAQEHGITLNGREWHIAVDGKTNTGKPYIVDAKSAEVDMKVDAEFRKWLSDIGIRKH